VSGDRIGCSRTAQQFEGVGTQNFRQRQTSLPTVQLDFLQLILETQAETTRWITDEVDCFMCQIHSPYEQGQPTYDVLRSYYFNVENPEGTSNDAFDVPSGFSTLAHRQLRQHLIYKIGGIADPYL
jgi:hypothetical protein